jgi:surface polysaccharide O-acyltransferase-like enzyme
MIYSAIHATNLVSNLCIMSGLLFLLFRFFDPNDRKYGTKGMSYLLRSALVVVVCACVWNILNSAQGLSSREPILFVISEVVLNAGLGVFFVWAMLFHTRNVSRPKR